MALAVLPQLFLNSNWVKINASQTRLLLLCNISGTILSLCIVVTQLLRPETDSSPTGCGKKASCKSCLLRQSAVVLCISYVGGWSCFPPLTESITPRSYVASQQQYKGVIFIYIYIYIYVLSTQNLWLPLPPKTPAWNIIVLFFCMKIFLQCVKQTTRRGSCCTVPLPPQVKYLQFVESITQYGVHLRWP